ncbi:MAG: hypothetical protein V4574_18845 [Pseudomonadota bacterium]
MSDRESWPEELDIAEAADVAWIKASGDSALWHEAAMAALAYRGDPHGFLPWLVEQPAMDRATAGWLFLWSEGTTYLRGERSFPYFDNISSQAYVDLMDALCARSERIGFASDRLGLDRDFEPQRQACITAIANGQVAPGITIPCAITGKPFAPPNYGCGYQNEDGILFKG